jgi:hypothetical protein
MQRIFMKMYFLCTMGSDCRVKRFTTGWKLSADDEEFKTEVPRWLRQESIDFYAAGFEALAKR